MPSIKVTDLVVDYGTVRALDGVSFSVDSGCVLGYIGPNGSGKSTTIRSMLGIHTDYNGDIEFFGRNIRTNSEYRRSIGYVPENCALYESLTGREYVLYSSGLYGLHTAKANTRLQHLALSFRISQSLDERISTYSKGMKQKIAIISAIIHNPEVLILDEPLDGLDAEAIEIFKRIIRMKADQGGVVLYSSHVMEIVERISDKILILKKGSIVAQGSLESIKANIGTNSDLASLFQTLTGTVDPDAEAAACMEILRG